MIIESNERSKWASVFLLFFLFFNYCSLIDLSGNTHVADFRLFWLRRGERDTNDHGNGQRRLETCTVHCILLSGIFVVNVSENSDFIVGINTDIS